MEVSLFKNTFPQRPVVEKCQHPQEGCQPIVRGGDLFPDISHGQACGSGQDGRGERWVNVQGSQAGGRTGQGGPTVALVAGGKRRESQSKDTTDDCLISQFCSELALCPGMQKEQLFPSPSDTDRETPFPSLQSHDSDRLLWTRLGTSPHLWHCFLGKMSTKF